MEILSAREGESLDGLSAEGGGIFGESLRCLLLCAFVRALRSFVVWVLIACVFVLWVLIALVVRDLVALDSYFAHCLLCVR